MNEQEFTRLYHNALQKAGVGVHIIEAAGRELNFDAGLQMKNIISLCLPIAEQLYLDIRVVVADAMEVSRGLPSSFTNNPEIKQHIRELKYSYEKEMKAEKRMLGIR